MFQQINDMSKIILCLFLKTKALVLALVTCSVASPPLFIGISYPILKIIHTGQTAKGGVGNSAVLVY